VLQEAFGSHFSDFSEEEDCMLVFINPFSLSERNILKMPSNMQMELTELKANSVLKMKFDELSSFPSASEMIVFLAVITMWTFSRNEKICPELCLSLLNYVQMWAVIFFHENDQKQTEVATVSLQLEELSVAFSYKFNPLTRDITGLVKAKQSQKSH